MNDDQALFVDLLRHHLVARGLDLLHFFVVAGIEIGIGRVGVGHCFIPLHFCPNNAAKRTPDQGQFSGFRSSSTCAMTP